MQKENYLPIIIESLVFGKNSDYPLYIKIGDRYVLYRSKALIFSHNDVLRLKNNGVCNLYIKQEDKKKYDEDMTGHMKNIVSANDKNFEDKAVSIYNYAKIYAQYIITTGNIKDIKEQLKQVVESMVEYILVSELALVNIIHMSQRDSGEVGHGMNVSIYAMTLAGRLGFSNKVSLYEIGLAGLVHDIGKIKISQQLLKKEHLTEEELNEIKKHPIYSKDILIENEVGSDNIINAVIEHHESSNGTGYPYGKMEENISAFGKILIIVNMFDSLMRDLPYKIKLEKKDALNNMILHRELYNNAFLKEFVLLMKESGEKNKFIANTNFIA
jgi:HD-GYP domain-containing protein (c-di-GMP phosphodiesterase class II)